MKEGDIEVRLIKKGKDNHLVSIGASGKNLLRELESYVDYIGKQQPDDLRPFLFAPTDPTQPLPQNNFDKQCKRVLQQVGFRLRKISKTYSFRATFVTNLLKSEVPIEKVHAIIGHKSIITPDRYRRT
jgi:site-specific recombinase XerD